MPGAILLRLSGLLMFSVSAAACVAVPLDLEQPVPRQFALPTPDSTFVGRRVAAAGITDGLNAVHLVESGGAAFDWRIALIARAERSVDLQTFEWHGARASRLIEAALLRAANRGVRVRLLIDDFLFRMDQETMAHLAAHPGIFIRAYNPYRLRGPTRFLRALATLDDFERLNRRMHNKSLIIDNAVAIAGGRNVSSRSFDMDPARVFRDRDLIVAGPAVTELSAAFDAYWNSRWAVPVERLSWFRSSPLSRARFLQDVARREIPANADRRSIGPVLENAIRARVRVIYDRPGKNSETAGRRMPGRTARAFYGWLDAAQAEVLVSSPQFWLSAESLAAFMNAARRGVRVRVLTTGLDGAEQIHLYSCFARRQRPRLLAAGIEIHELRTDAASRHRLIDGFADDDFAPVMALHAKTAVFDANRVYIGSMNLDVRSARINTEMGLFIESDELARQMANSLRQDMTERNAWVLRHGNDGETRWQTRRAESRVVLRRLPSRSFRNRLLFRLSRLVPVCGLI